MVTDREKEILHWIKQNPMISQKELADLAGITRSGVSAHLSNLTKKGLISGKGYVFPPKKYVTVIGGVNIDIYGTSDQRIVGKSSNTGKVHYSLGGVGRNVAENLARLDIETYFMTVFGNDQSGESFKENAINNNINIMYSKQMKDEQTSTYLYVNQPDGERVVGVDDMEINQYITPEFVQRRLPVINASELLVIDSNIPRKTIEWLYEHVEVPIFAKAVSINKAPNLMTSHVNLDTLVINAVEASLITKIEVTDESSAKECVRRLKEYEIPRICLYIDSFGIVYADENQLKVSQYSDQEVVNTNGAGAAIVSALAWGRVQKISFMQSVMIATQASEITAQSAASTSEEISQISNL